MLLRLRHKICELQALLVEALQSLGGIDPSPLILYNENEIQNQILDDQF